MSAVPIYSILTRRGEAILSLQRASLVLSWSVFIVNLSTSLGAFGLWIPLSVGVVSMAFEKYLIYCHHVAVSRARENARLAQMALETQDRDNDSIRKTVSGLDGGQSPSQRTPAIIAPSDLSYTYQLPFVVGRLIMTGLWMCAFAAILVFVILLTGWRYSMSFSAHGIIELILAVVQVGVMIASSVLVLKERKALLLRKDAAEA